MNDYGNEAERKNFKSQENKQRHRNMRFKSQRIQDYGPEKTQ